MDNKFLTARPILLCSHAVPVLKKTFLVESFKFNRVGDLNTGSLSSEPISRLLLLSQIFLRTLLSPITTLKIVHLVVLKTIEIRE